MTIQSCQPLLNVADIDVSLGFWRDLIGFEVATLYAPEGRPQFAALQSGEVRLMLNARGGDPAARRARPHYTEAVIYLGVPSVRALVQSLRAKGFETPDPEAQTYGLEEMTVRDPDGYEIAFTSRLEGAGGGHAGMSWAAVELNVNGALRPFHFRPGGSDERVIAEVLRGREYDFARLRRGPDLNALYARLVAAGRTPLVIDAGANIGASAIWFAATFPAAHVVALEPEAANFALLAANTAGANIEPLQAALAARPGRVTLIDPGEGAWGFRTAAAGAVPSPADIPAVTVSDIFAAKAAACAPFIVKIDIEGGESDVFSAATDWVAQTPVIVIELHDWLLTGQASARPFLQCVSALDRDFVYVGENVFSIDNQLGRFG